MNTNPRLFYGWVIVATAALGLFLGAFPITVFSFGVFLPSFVRDFHSGRAAVSLAFTIHNLVSGCAAVLVGRFADRYGARRVILPGLLSLALILISAQTIGSHIVTLYAFYFALGLAAPATTTVPYALVVSRWFDRRRGIAIGLMMVGLGVGAIVMPPIAQLLIAAFGWRSAFALVGCVILFLPMPIVALLLRDSPTGRDLSAGDSPTGSRIAARPLEGMGWAESYRSGTFWLLIAAFVLLAASVHACVVHMPELFADRGASAASAAAASSMIGLALLVGRVGSGYFLDRYFGPTVTLFICGGVALGIAFLLIGTTGPFALTGAFLVGLGMGAEVDIIAFLMGRYFGLRSLGSTLGFAFGAFVIAGGLGPLAMGLAFDRTGSYHLPLAGSLAATLISAVLVTRLGPYRFHVAGRQGVASQDTAEVQAAERHS